MLLGGYVPFCLPFGDPRRSGAVGIVAIFAGVGLLGGLYVVAVGGDYLHACLFLPSLFAVCAPIAIVPATRPTSRQCCSRPG